MPSTATLADLREVIQVAMGWERHHLHVFSDGDRQYGDNARDETAVTMAGLIPKAGDWLGYRYDFGDMWDHDIEVEKVHQAADLWCSTRGRACPQKTAVVRRATPETCHGTAIRWQGRRFPWRGPCRSPRSPRRRR
ncbi:plasmid pRiA4b ORF-3 family protein [Streptosporangium sp. NPDC006013]|uniref:plasmid pRiA4b ORF-3 family protein n=1 Tax=Streptosporangium sp. NPDC006013 TaxID=3155596 RepID=UPI0033B086DE